MSRPLPDVTKRRPVENQRFNLWLLLVLLVFGRGAMQASGEEPYDCHSADMRIPLKTFFCCRWRN